MSIKVRDVIEGILLELSGKYPEERISSVRELLDYNEPGIAIENLCVDIHEFDILISREAFSSFEKLVDHYKISENYLEFLRSNIKI